MCDEPRNVTVGELKRRLVGLADDLVVEIRFPLYAKTQTGMMLPDGFKVRHVGFEHHTSISNVAFVITPGEEFGW